MAHVYEIIVVDFELLIYGRNWNGFINKELLPSSGRCK